MSWLNERLRQMQQAAAQQEAERQRNQPPQVEVPHAMAMDQKLLQEIKVFHPTRLLEDIKRDVWGDGKVYKMLEVVDHSQSTQNQVARGMYGNTMDWIGYALIHEYPGLLLDWEIVGYQSTEGDGHEAIRKPHLVPAKLFEGVGIKYNPYGCDLEVVSVEGGSARNIVQYFYYGHTSGKGIPGEAHSLHIGRIQQIPTPQINTRFGDVQALTQSLQDVLAEDCQRRIKYGRLPAQVAQQDRMMKLAEYNGGTPR